MKQGMGSNVRSGGKVEPNPKAKNIRKVADIGLQQLRTKGYSDLGRGYKAPMHSQATSKSGSQGKY